jgi:hypothetical protein
MNAEAALDLFEWEGGGCKYVNFAELSRQILPSQYNY